MHKRFRRGLNHLIHWYSQHDADDRAEDSLSFDQAEKHEDEEEEELVVVLVTHGAGCNALIGALTGQPVLLDVGMASLTMAIRRDDAPQITTYASSNLSSAAESRSHSPTREMMHPPLPRRGSLDLGLSSVYEMKLVSSSEHLRPGADPSSASSSRSASAIGAHHRQRLGSHNQASARGGMDSGWNMDEPARSSTSTALGSILRHSATHEALHAAGLGAVAGSRPATATPHLSTSADASGPSPPYSPSLWTPPGSRTPLLPVGKTPEERKSLFSPLNDASGRVSPGQDLVLDFSNSPPDSRPGSSGGGKNSTDINLALSKNIAAVALNESLDGTSDRESKSLKSSENGHAHDNHYLGVPESPPQALSRTLSQKGLWGTKPAGVKVMRNFGMEPKRRWSATPRNGSEVD